MTTLFDILDCVPGYYSLFCNLPCKYPQYGENCQRECNCNLLKCHHIKGCLNTAGKRNQIIIKDWVFKLDLKLFYIEFKKLDATTIESGPRCIYFLKSLVFSRENYMISSILSVLSCYTTCIAHIFNISGIWNKTHGKGLLINSHSHRHLTPPYTFTAPGIYERKGVHLS